MKKIFFSVGLCWNLLFVAAQSFSASSSTLNMGVVLETQVDSLPLVLRNPTNSAIQVSDIFTLPDPYGHPVFSVSQSNFIVPAQDSVTIQVRFSPVHNLAHNSELWVVNNGHRGTIAVDLQAQGRYSLGYYASTENKSEQALKTTFTTLLAQGYVDLGYNGARDQMFLVLDNEKVNGQGATVNTLECVYTGTQITGYTTRTDAQNMGFNTEHTFPQSLFNSSTPMLSDMFHLFPTTEGANNERGNKPFNVLTSGITWNVGGSKSSSSEFEPRDYHKGKVARAMMYFVLRYQDYSCFFQGQEAILKEWNRNFVPSAIEKTRNALIANSQKNRNPFIDYPQFAERIQSLTTCQTSVANTSQSVAIPELEIDYSNIPINTDVDYGYWIINSGTAPLIVQDFQVSTAYFSIVNGTQPVTIAAGDAHKVLLRANVPTAVPYMDELIFSTNIPNSSPSIIPIKANGIVSEITPAQQLQFSLLPNPAHHTCEIRCGQKLDKIELIDGMGRILAVPTHTSTQGASLIVSALPAGLYTIKVQAGETVGVKKLWIEP